MDLSIVTTLYRSSTFIEEFYSRICATAERVTADFELVFVNDGSPDNSLEIVLSLLEKDARVKVVDLSRNFGHHYAAVAGLAQTLGDRVFIIDVDLEEQPEYLLPFIEEFERQQTEVVFAVQRSRGGNVFKKHSGSLFYKLFNLLSETKIPENVCTMRLMSRRYVDAVIDVKDKNIFLAGNYAWIGFKQTPFPIEKRTRKGSSYTLKRRLSLFLNAITSFTAYPLWIIFLTGLSISIAFALIGFTLIIQKILSPASVVEGWVSVIVSIWFLAGIIISFLGIIGLYIAKIFNEVKERPQYIIRAIYSRGAEKTVHLSYKSFT
jgi:putative glycosyltransferase